MPNREEHLAAYRHNKALAEKLIVEDEPAWAIVLAFYSALHLLDAYLLQTGRPAGSHQARLDRFKQLEELASVLHPYRELEDRSRRARYDLWSFDSKEAQDAVENKLAYMASQMAILLREEVG